MKLLLEKLLWLGLLGVITVRPWVLEFGEQGGVGEVQWAGLCLTLVWLAIKYKSYKRLSMRLTLALLVLFIAYLTASLWSRDSHEAFLQGHALVFGLLLCVGAAMADAPQRTQLLWVLVGTGSLLAIHALWQAAVVFPSLANFPWGSYSSQGDHGALSAHTIEFATQVISRQRVFGPFALPGLLAAALGILLPISFYVLRPWATTSVRRIIMILGLGAQTTALLMTQSLGGIASVCAAIFWVLVKRRSSWQPKMAVLCVAVTTIGIFSVLRPELSNFDHPRNPIVQRWRYWMSAVRMIGDHPVRGVGAANYAALYPDYQLPKSTHTRYAHNVLLQVWAEWGLLGFAGLVGLVFLSLRLATLKGLGFEVAIWVFWMMAFIDIIWFIPQLTCLWWPLVGLSMRGENVRGGIT